MRKKTKTNKRFVIDKIKMTFITEPFYNGEKKINKRFVVDKKNAIYQRTFLTTEKKQKQNKTFLICKKMPFILEPFLPWGENKNCNNLTKSKVAIYSDYKSSPDAIIYWRFNLSN